MSEAFPAIPRAFYRAFLLSFLIHLGALLTLAFLQPAVLYIQPQNPPPTAVIWVKPGAVPLGGGAASRLLPPPQLAVPTPAPTPALSELTRSEKKAAADKKLAEAELAKKQKQEQKERERALALVREMERRRLLASALQEVQQSLGKKGQSRKQHQTAETSSARPGPGSPQGTAAGGSGAGGQVSLEDYQYQESVRAVYEKGMNFLYGLRFRGQNLSTKCRVRVAADGRVVEAVISSRSGSYSFDAAVQGILEQVKSLPPPPADRAAFYLDKGFLIDFNPKE